MASSVSVVKRLWTKIIKKRKKQLSFLLALMLASGLSEFITLGAAVPFIGILLNPSILESNKFLQFILEKLQIDNDVNLLSIFAIAFIFAVICATFIRLLNLWCNKRLAALIGSDLSCLAYELTLSQQYITHINRNSSSIINIITQQIPVTVDAINSILQALTSLFVIACLSVGLIIVDWKVTLLSIAFFLCVYLIIAFWTKKILLANSKKVVRCSEIQYKTLQEGLGSIRDVILESNQNLFVDIFKTVDLPMRLVDADTAFIANSPRFILEGFGILLISSLAYYSSLQQNNDPANILTTIGVFAIAAQRLLPSMQMVYSVWSRIKGWEESIQKVLGLLEQPKIIEEHIVSSTDLTFQKSLRFDNVSFRYPSSNGKVLDKINFTINKGERVGIVGTTGSGKSTLCDLIMGLLRPDEGSIYVDDIDLYSAEKKIHKSWMKLISHVPQNIYLSDSTILENIAFGVPSDMIDLDRIYNAAQMANISGYIESLPMTYNTMIGENGVKLSGGQRQRIGIARALYNQSQILVFDEATSALDTETELNVMDAIYSLNKNLTILIIAHRTSTITSCDKILNVKNGVQIDVHKQK